MRTAGKGAGMTCFSNGSPACGVDSGLETRRADKLALSALLYYVMFRLLGSVWRGSTNL